ENGRRKQQTKDSRHGSSCEAARIARGQLLSNPLTAAFTPIKSGRTRVSSTKIFTSPYFLLAWLRGTCILRIVNSLYPGAESELRLRLTPTRSGAQGRRIKPRIERIAIPRPSHFPRPSHGEQSCREAAPLAAPC